MTLSVSTISFDTLRFSINCTILKKQSCSYDEGLVSWGNFLLLFMIFDKVLTQFVSPICSTHHENWKWLHRANNPPSKNEGVVYLSIRHSFISSHLPCKTYIWAKTGTHTWVCIQAAENALGHDMKIERKVLISGTFCAISTNILQMTCEKLY